MSTTEKRRAWVEVDLDALLRNYDAIRSRVGPDTALLPMLKADGYGLGARPVAATLSRRGPWALGVATLEEAGELRSGGLGDRIVVFSPCAHLDAEGLVALGAEPAVSSVDALAAYRRAASPSSPLRVHLEIDTGMGRLGLVAAEADRWIPELRRLLEDGSLEVASTFTHFHSAESDPAATRRQVERFESAVEAIRSAGIDPGPRHLANSAAILRHPETEADVVRPGLYLYGGLGGEPVVSVRARLVDVRELPAGHAVSYAARYRTEERSRIGTAGIGYGDGLRRELSGRLPVLVRGRRVPIRGAICMDVTALDLSEVPDAEPGGVVTVLGRDGRASVELDEMAEAIGTIPYEILTGLGRRLPRVYRGGDGPAPEEEHGV